MKKMLLVFALMLALVALGGQAQASLNLSYQFIGNGDWSLSGVGSNNTPVGTMNVTVPAGSTVQKAFLYSSMWAYPVSAAPTAPTVEFDGISYGVPQFTPLTTVNPQASFYLKAFRADVTSQVSAKVGSGGAFTFTVNSENPNTNVDGEVLAIVYSNSALAKRTIAFLDGGSATAGDNFKFNFANPVDPTVAGFEALMSLGIGFSFQLNATQQYSIVDVNGTRLTTAAGGEDDGISTNGGLITVGGVGDSSANPANPFATPTDPRSDDELYDLTSFLKLGDISFSVFTQNPSFDDNIFFAGVNVTAEGNVVTTPLPASVLFLGTGLVGLALTGLRRRVKK